MTDDEGPRAAWHGREYAPQAEHHRILDESFIARHPPDADSVVVMSGAVLVSSPSGSRSSRLPAE